MMTLSGASKTSDPGLALKEVAQLIGSDCQQAHTADGEEAAADAHVLGWGRTE
jgi:hypothetical protein